MNREILRAGIAILVSLALLEVGSGRLLAEGLFEDEPATQGQAGVATPTAEGKALATQIVQKLNESYYKMFQVVGGFEATYTVQKDNEEVGKATISANLPAGAPGWTMKFEGELSDEEKKKIENLLEAAWTPLLTDCTRMVISANESDEGFALSLSYPDGEWEMLVSKDYRLLSEEAGPKDGAKTVWTYQDQDVGGKRYVETLELKTGRIWTRFTYTYFRKEGTALIKRIEIEDGIKEVFAGVEPRVDTRYLVSFEGVKFKKAAAVAAGRAGTTEEGAGEKAAGGPVIDASAWDDLSREVIPKVLEMSLDRGTMLRYVRGASCTIDVVISTKMIASTTNPYFTPPAIPPSAVSFSYSFEDGDNDGMLTEDEVTIETTNMSDANMRFAAGRISKGLRELATSSLINVLPKANVKTRKTQQGYEVTLTLRKTEGIKMMEEAGKIRLTPLRLTVSNDFRVTGMRTQSADGLDEVTTFKHVRTGGKWLLTEVEKGSGGATAFAARDKSVLTYRMEGGLPLVTKTVVDSSTPLSTGTLQTHQEYTLSNWKLVKRDKPLEVGALALEEKTPDEPTDEEEPQ